MSLVDRTVQRMTRSSWFRRVGPKVVPPMDRFVHRVTGGRFTPSGAYRPTLVLTALGRTSGQPRTTPLMCIPDGEALYVVASNYGRDHHPQWSSNLIANPEARVSFRGEDRPVRAHLLTPEEKAETWPRLLETWPLYDFYEERSGRDLRVFRLDRRTS